MEYYSFSPGFTTSGLGSLIYDMGPQCASCNPQAISEVLRRYQFGSTLNSSDDTAVISKPPLSEAEVAQLAEVSRSPMSQAYAANDTVNTSM